MSKLQPVIEQAFENRSEITPENVSAEVRQAVLDAIDLLDSGQQRVAEPADGGWQVNEWLKKAVLLSFRIRENQVMPGGFTQYYDKVDSKFDGMSAADHAASGVRVVPPAVARKGAYVAPGVVMMPSYVNIGAYVDSGTMVDTWATVGSCAQIGKNVHLSGGVGIGGVLEPLQAAPTIIEDNCFIGARSEVVEGVIVERNSVISMGVYIGQRAPRYTTAKPARSATVASPRVRSWSPATCPPRTAATASTARSSSSAWTKKPAPRLASTNCCARSDAGRWTGRRFTESPTATRYARPAIGSLRTTWNIIFTIIASRDCRGFCSSR